MKKLVPFRSVLVFGGAGFIGSNWANHILRASDARVHIFDNLSRQGVHRNLEWLRREATLRRCRKRLPYACADAPGAV